MANRSSRVGRFATFSGRDFGFARCVQVQAYESGLGLSNLEGCLLAAFKLQDEHLDQFEYVFCLFIEFVPSFRETLQNNAGIFILTDIIYTLLPMTIILKLHRPRRERIVISFLMALGFLATFATIPKIIRASTYGFRTDPTYLSSDVLLWSLVEVHVGIIAACVPTLRSVFEAGLRSVGLLGSCTQEVEMKSVEFGDIGDGDEERKGEDCAQQRTNGAYGLGTRDEDDHPEKFTWLKTSTARASRDYETAHSKETLPKI
jgi:hypothetical protein